MNRRELLSTTVAGLGAGALSLFTPKSASAVLPATGEVDLALPPGLVELTSSTGDVMEVKVPWTGITTLQYQKLALLRGLWQIYKPGIDLYNKLYDDRPFYDALNPRVFDLWDTTPSPTVGGVSSAAWAYRHPQDWVGDQLRGIDQSPMTLWLSTSGPIPALTIQLVELDIAPKIYQDLQAIPFPPMPPVRRVLKQWSFPAGSGSRTKRVDPFAIPWNARCLALRRVQSVVQTTHIRLMSEIGPLEIGVASSPAPEIEPDSTGTCPEDYVYDINTKACRLDSTAPAFLNYWYCMVEPAHGELRGPNWMSVPSNRDPVAYWHFVHGEAGRWFVIFNTRLMIGPPTTSTNAPNCGTAPPPGVDPWTGNTPPTR